MDITRPYLIVRCDLDPSTQTQPLSEGYQSHRFPEILAFGIVLLEILCGEPIEVGETEDSSVVAINKLYKWKDSCKTPEMQAIPEGLYKAIIACIHPKEYTSQKLDKANISALEVRNFIFQRVLYPLEQALLIAYEVRPDMLLEQSPEHGIPPGFFDGEDNDQVDTSQ